MKHPRSKEIIYDDSPLWGCFRMGMIAPELHKQFVHYIQSGK